MNSINYFELDVKRINDSINDIYTMLTSAGTRITSRPSIESLKESPKYNTVTHGSVVEIEKQKLNYAKKFI